MTTDAYPFEENGHPWELKCWGKVQHVFNSPDVAVSVLKVNKGFRCSVHYHKHRINGFTVVSGKIKICSWLVGETPERPVWSTNILRTGDTVNIPIRYPHMFEVIESGIIVEVYTPDGGPVDINDIVRFDEGGPV